MAFERRAGAREGGEIDGSPATLPEVLAARAELAPGRTAFRFLAAGETEGEALTYRALAERAAAIAGLVSRHAGGGERVLIALPSSLDYVAAFFGVLAAGAVAVPAFPPRAGRADERLRAIVDDAEPALALTTAAAIGRAPSGGGGGRCRWEALEGLSPGGGAAPFGGGDPDALAVLQYTSGSTTRPRGVMLTQRNLLAGSEFIRRRFGHGGESRGVMWLPLFHDMGLVGGVLQPVYAGFPCCLLEPTAVAQNPLAWLRAIARERATTSGGPNFAFELAARAAAGGGLPPDLDLSSWAVAFCGAEPVREGTLRAFARAFAPSGFRPEAFLPCYGLAEATLMVSGGPWGVGLRAATLDRDELARGRAREAAGGAGVSSVVSCGAPGGPGAGASVVVVAGGRPAGEGEVGEIWASGAAVAAGYFRRPEESEWAFGAALPGSPSRYLRTGDLGFLRGGELYVTGRLKEVICVRGRNVYPHDLEAASAESHPAFAGGGAAAFEFEAGGGARVGLVQEVGDRQRLDDAEAALDAIRASCAERCEVALDAVVLVRRGALPRTTSGKVQRGACRARLLEGTWPGAIAERRAGAPGSGEGEVPAAALARRLERALGRPLAPSDAEVPLVRLGVDSLVAVELSHLVAPGGEPPSIARVLASTPAELSRTAAGAGSAGAPGPGPAGGVSVGQRALWFLWRLGPADPADQIAAALRVPGGVDEGGLREALRRSVARHAVLRTSYPDEGGGPGRREHGAEHFAFEVVGAAGLDEAGLAARLRALADAPFDLERGPVLRAWVLRREGEDVVLFVVHHVAADLWSLEVLLAEINGSPGGPSAAFDEHVARERALLEGPGAEARLRFWRERLAGARGALGRAGARGAPAVALPVRVGRELTASALGLARREGATPFAVLLAAFFVTLQRLGGRNDLVVATPSAGRSFAGSAGGVGYFMNALPLRADLSDDPTFRELVGRAAAGLADALEHELPFATIVEGLGLSRGGDAGPLGRVLFAYHGGRAGGEGGEGVRAMAAGATGVAVELLGRRAETMALRRGGAQSDLALVLSSVGGELVGTLEAREGVLDEGVLRRAAELFCNVLEGATAAPETPLGRLRGLGPDDGCGAYEPDARWAQAASTAPARFGRAAARRAEAVALRAPRGVAWSYGELDAKSRRVAYALARRGVGLERRVLLCAERSPEAVAALLGVLRAGGAYVPVDPGWPRARIDYVARDCGAALALVDAAGAAALEGAPCPVAGVGELLGEPAPAGWAPPSVAPGDLAYVIYTSGSQGEPKGVAVEHRSLGAFADAIAARFELTEADRVLQFAPLTFDTSVIDLLVPLTAGAEVALRSDRVLESAAAFFAECAGYGVTVAPLPTSFWHSLAADLAEAPRPAPPGLRLVMVGGEAALPDRLAAWHASVGPGVRLLNAYGPTETTVGVTADDVSAGPAALSPGGEVSIGRGLAHARVFVADAEQRPVEVGVPGELVVGGEAVGRGYLGRERLTRERFVPDPGVPGGRLYRTGDRVRRLLDGRLEFLGRDDGQVKIDGFRVELAEIEAALAALPGVRYAAAVAREAAPGRKALVAFYEPTGDALPEREVRRRLAQRLPGYMLPARVVALAAMPRFNSGKIDRKALPEALLSTTDGAETDGPKAPPPSALAPTERLVAEVWGEVLGAEGLRRDDDFFSHGGTSLVAARVVARLRRRLGIELPLRAIFEAPTLGDFASRVEASALELLLARAAGVPAGAGGVASGGARSADRPEAPPLSLAQERLWALEQSGRGAAYHCAAVVALRGRLDVGPLRRAFGVVLGRHEALRTSFPAGPDGAPWQRVAPEANVALEVYEARDLPPGLDAHDWRALAAWGRAPLDVVAGPPLAARLLRLGESEHRLVLSVHHLVVDGWSTDLLVRELVGAYAALVEGREPGLPALPLQYADFASAQRRDAAGRGWERELSFWARELAGAPATSTLPSDRPHPARRTYAGAQHEFALDAGLRGRLLDLSRRHGATLFMTIAAATATLLARHGRAPEIVLGTPVAGRDAPELESLIGFFANMIPLRIEVAEGASFGELLGQVRARTLAALDAGAAPFERIVEAAAPPRRDDVSPLFQVALALRQAVAPAPTPAAPLHARTLGVLDGGAKFDLTIVLEEREGEGVAGWVEYATELYDPATVARFAAQLVCLLRAAADDASRPARALPIVGAVEREALLARGRPRAAASAPAARLDELFSTQAARSPNEVAVRDGERSLTYAELDQRASAIAARLRAVGAEPGGRVALRLGRSADQVASMLAVWKAGGAYVPIDPATPAGRAAFMLRDSGANWLLTERAAGELDAAPDVARVLIDDPAPASTLASAAGGEGDAYVIYTSGSTGVPKGVVVTHHNVARLFEAARAPLGLSSGGVWTLFHSYAFDFSVWETWGALLHGGRLVIVPEGVARSPEDLWTLIERERVSVLSQTPSAFAQLAAAAPEGAVERSALGLIVLGGEALAPAVTRPWLEKHGDRRPRLVNMYGITETTVHVTWREVRAGDPPSGPGGLVGEPLDDLGLYLLEPGLEPAPVGMTAELFVSGAGLARGYLNRPELDAERFLPAPWGERVYRTGDLARRRADGELEFHGRADAQVKLRGFRVEAGEVEAALRRCPGVEQAAVVLRDDVLGGPHLVAYVAGGPGGGGAEALRARLRDELPHYMVPSYVVRLGALPLTPNGKLDRAALPAPALDAAVVPAAQPPRGEKEEAAARAWAEVLGLGAVGRDQSFFDVGGHSMAAMRACARLRDRGYRAEVAALFASASLAEFASTLEPATAPRSAADAAAPGGPSALTYAQQRIWFAERLEPGTPRYHVAGAVRLGGRLDRGALERALALVVRRHEALRTTFGERDDVPFQTARERADVALDLVDLGARPAPERDAELERLGRAFAAEPFGLRAGPLLRTRLVRLADDEHRLLVVLHHLVADGWSLRLLARELSEAYAAFARGAEPALPPVRRQLAAYAADERRDAGRGTEGLDYWAKKLGGELPDLALPTDRPRGAERSHLAGHVRFALGGAFVGRLEALARERGATLFMALLAAFEVLLHRHSGDEDLVVGTAISGRDEPDLESMVGLCINMLALRVGLEGRPTFDEVLERTRRTALEAYAHRAVPFDRVVEALRPRRGAADAPVFRVTFALDDAADAWDAGGLRVELSELDIGASEYDLSFNLKRAPGGLAGSVRYRRDLFEPTTVERLVAHYRALLESAAAGPSRSVDELPMLSGAERDELLYAHNRTAVAFDAPPCLHQLVEAQAALTPAAIALRQGGRAMSYAELDARGDALAGRLRALGVGAGDRVGVLAERSFELVMALLGVLKAGAAFVPLDPEYPAERLAYMWADSGARALVRAGTAAVPVLGVGPQLELNATEGPPLAGGRVEAGVGGESLAYVMYTSGTTGRPKGVMIPHRGIRNRILWGQLAYGLAPEARVLHKAPLGFDAAVWEIFWPLSVGATLVVAPPGVQRDPAALAACIERERVNVVHFVPSLLEASLAEGSLARCSSLTHVYSGGEALTAATAERLLGRLDVRLFNQYGPTETSANVTYAEYRRGGGGRDVPIGRPIANTAAYVLDARGEPAPYGVTGELFIGGANVGLGYLNLPDETAACFLADPFAGGTMFRTGDLARRRADGSLEYVGRRDRQVKLRGVRVELGEVEAVLMGHPAVADAAVVVEAPGSDAARLVAYVVADASALVAVGEHARRLLPAAMAPASFVALEALPLGPSGKVDHRALTALAAPAARAAAPRTPRDEFERRLAEIWAAVLSADEVGPDDNFFDLGGHSLLGTKLLSRVQSAFGVELPMRDLFAAPTVAQMASRLRGRGGAPGPAAAGPELRRDERADLLDRLEGLDDAELDALLADEGQS